ncbi:hypothetical protein ACP70R_020908 [Stipagrostis hirtigluma subsp. patula]
MAARAALLLAVSLVLAAVASGHQGPHGSCPKDALKLHVCANVLDLVKANVGSPPYQPCCSLLDGLVDLEAAACLCTAIKANVLGINLNIPIDLSVILNNCRRSCSSGFQCA